MTSWSRCRTSTRASVRPNHRYTNAKRQNLISGSLCSEFFLAPKAASCEAKKVEQKFLTIVFIHSDITLYDPYRLNLSKKETEKILTANVPRNGMRKRRSRGTRALFSSLTFPSTD